MTKCLITNFLDDLKKKNLYIYNRLSKEVCGSGITVLTWSAVSKIPSLKVLLKNSPLTPLDPYKWYEEYKTNLKCAMFKEYQSYKQYVLFQLEQGLFFQIDGVFYNKFKAIDYLNFHIKSHLQNKVKI